MKTVLGVEADEDLRALLKLYIGGIAGTDCVTCRTAEAALEVLATRACDAVVSDRRMDGMDGVALAGEVSRRWPSVPVIIITGGPPVPDGTPGVLCTLRKPFSRAELARALDRAFAARAGLV